MRLAGPWSFKPYTYLGFYIKERHAAPVDLEMNRLYIWLHSIGSEIRRTVSVAGYVDTVMSGVTSPRFTAGAIPICEMAANGCRWLLNQCFDMSLDVHREFVIDVT